MKSPCRECENEFMDKTGCLGACEKLGGFQTALQRIGEMRIVTAQKPVTMSHSMAPQPARQSIKRTHMICSNCKKEKPNFGRGLCSACYSRARYREKKLATTAPVTPLPAPPERGGLVIGGIEKGISIPPPRRGANAVPSLYPFGAMEVGDSFKLDCNPDCLKETRKKMWAACNGYSKRHPEIRFVVRMLDDHIRIWRVEAKDK